MKRLGSGLPLDSRARLGHEVALCHRGWGEAAKSLGRWDLLPAPRPSRSGESAPLGADHLERALRLLEAEATDLSAASKHIQQGIQQVATACGLLSGRAAGAARRQLWVEHELLDSARRFVAAASHASHLPAPALILGGNSSFCDPPGVWHREMRR